MLCMCVCVCTVHRILIYIFSADGLMVVSYTRKCEPLLQTLTTLISQNIKTKEEKIRFLLYEALAFEFLSKEREREREAKNSRSFVRSDRQFVDFLFLFFYFIIKILLTNFMCMCFILFLDLNSACI